MEKFMKKIWKKNDGFTLVELIVVIAILGILAAVAVPAYSGYINKANEAGDITSLDAIKTAAIAALAEKGAVDKITVTTRSAKVTGVTAEVDGTSYTLMGGTGDEAADFALYLGSDEITLKSEAYKNGATWEDGEW